MAKTKEELDQLKQECETLTNKLKELTDDELKQVTGGVVAALAVMKVADIPGTSVEIKLK